MKRALLFAGLATAACFAPACSGVDGDSSSQAFAKIPPAKPPIVQPIPMGPDPIFLDPEERPDLSTPPDMARPPYCNGHVPTAINFATEWDGTSSLWGSYKGVVVQLKSDADGLRYAGVDPVSLMFVWQGYGNDPYLITKLTAMTGSCKANSSTHTIINDLPIPGIPKKDPPVTTQTEKPIDFCDSVEAMFRVANDDLKGCHY
jgi:hypothetical protein